MIKYSSWVLAKQTLKGILECKRFMWKWHLGKEKESRIGQGHLSDHRADAKFLTAQWEVPEQNCPSEEYHTEWKWVGPLPLPVSVTDWEPSWKNSDLSFNAAVHPERASWGRLPASHTSGTLFLKGDLSGTSLHLHTWPPCTWFLY